MKTRKIIEISVLAILIIIAVPFYIAGLMFQIPGHVLTSIGYLCWGDTWSAKHVWLDLLQDINAIWNGR